MRVLVTRPEPDASDLAAVLRGRGFEVLVDPMLQIHAIEPLSIPERAYQAVLLTSSNALRVLAQRPDRARILALPVFAVGARTAERARALGARHVEAGPGGVTALADLTARVLDPNAGPVLYLSGADRAGDLDGDLRARGFSVDLVEVYTADPAQGLAPHTRNALEFGNLDFVLVASRRTGEAFLDAIVRHNLGSTLRRVTAVVISPQVARAMERASFARVVVAAEPTEDALLDRLSEAASADGTVGQ